MSMVDEQTQPRFYEPWQPQIGQRVVTRVNPECKEQYVLHGDFDQGSGLPGLVVGKSADDGASHAYCVRLLETSPDGLPNAGIQRFYAWYAASELEPVDDEVPA